MQGKQPRFTAPSRRFAWLVLFFAAGGFLGGGAAEPTSPPFRIGFASSMFSDVNENDAKAAVKIWGQLIAREQNVPTDPVPSIFKDVDEMTRSLRDKEVDAVGITMTEYDRLRREVHFAPIFLTYNSRRITEQYVLLVHREGAVKHLADLRGRRLHLHSNPRACLAPLWLDTLLARQGHPAAVRFVGEIHRNTKLSKVVLPVFFRQADACIVTRSAFDTMRELNPQLGAQLTALAESAAMVPALFAFRADYNPHFKEKLIAGINDLKETPAGQQVLTIFHSEDIAQHPTSTLDTALELIAAHRRLVKTKQGP